jgi:hypothetical protein
VPELGPEDIKLVTLARATRARLGTAEGAAVRDGTGRTYAATSVELTSLALSALQAAVVMAVASGAESLEAAAAVVSDGPAVDDASLAAVRELAGAGVPVIVATADGTVQSVLRT